MTSKLEQEFYKVFEISPATVQEYGATYFWDTIEIDGKRYTPIDDHKLLEMICIYNSTYTNGYTNYSLLNERNVEKLKEQILKNCLIVRDDIKLQIQQLFKEDNQWAK